jgi:cytidylate kinase
MTSLRESKRALLGLPSTIAIDGPVASGKTTLARALAHRLGYLYFDTGVMYRAVTWCAISRSIDTNDEAAVALLARTLQLDVGPSSDSDGYVVYADGENITACLRKPEVDRYVSPVSAYRDVREAMTREQRRIGERGHVVMAGRDIGTVVLPDADLKIYLDASLEARAERRWREIQDQGKGRELGVVVAETKARDKIDTGRLVAPLRPAHDAVVIDTTDLSAHQVLETVWEIIETRRKAPQEQNHAG